MRLRNNAHDPALDAKAEELGAIYQEKCDAAARAERSVPESVVKSFLAEHNRLAVAYGTLPRENGKAARDNKMPPDAIIITDQISENIRAGKYHGPPYFNPREVPPIVLALLKRVHYIMKNNPEAAASAKKTLLQLTRSGLVPPSGIESLNLYNNDTDLIRQNSYVSGSTTAPSSARTLAVPPSQRKQISTKLGRTAAKGPSMRKNSRQNTHLTNLQDKLAYIDVVENLIKFGALTYELRLHEQFAKDNGYDVDGYYNELERRMKSAGLHGCVERLRLGT